MIAALFALAAAMIIGGCAAVIQGFPYVRLESGLAMVIAGSVAASSGAVLLGLGVLALAFRRVARAIEQAPASGVRDTAAASTEEGRIRPPPLMPTAPAFIVPSVVEPPFDPERSRIAPSLDVRTDAEPAPAPPPIEPPTRAEPMPAAPPSLARAPILQPKPDGLKLDGLKPDVPRPDVPRPDVSRSETPPPAPVTAPEDDLFAAPEAPAEPEPSLRPSLDTVPEPAPPAPKPDARTVVGRYASGGNTYVMFENGSIEAETPQGRFTFASLDELKAFVDNGGESGTRGAA
ncbi:hypothetical protein [Methylobacterium sp. J-026]|uniref:hypothetical protein n=1 Tax=Methylobacterium sp. J-026 TaxID=2836624 RepID=UPI001FB9C1B3|nr:hypothetical protein [Methylobacterium sp. J-026]